MRVLAVVDIHEQGDRVVAAAARWAAQLGAKLDLAWATGGDSADPQRVVHIQRLFGEPPDPGPGQEVLSALMVAHVPEAQRGRARVLPGRALEVLAPATEGYDAVLLGSHGRVGVARAVLGSVADHLLRHARCPVGLMPLRGRMEPTAARRVLASTDLTEAATRAIATGLALLGAEETHVLHVVTSVPGGPRTGPEGVLQSAISELQALLDEVGVRADEVHVRATSQVNAGGTISSVATELDASCIVTAARNADDVAAIGIGSVTGRVQHLTAVPVWVIPPGGGR